LTFLAEKYNLVCIDQQGKSRGVRMKIKRCEWCGREFVQHMGRPARFCCRVHSDAGFAEERRKGSKWVREQREQEKGATSMSDQQNQIEALISSKIAADDADSGWVVAYIMVQALPVLKDIAENLKAINEGIAPPEEGRSVGAELRLILNMLERKLQEGKEIDDANNHT
jgi:hypothetical protein